MNKLFIAMSLVSSAITAAPIHAAQAPAASPVAAKPYSSEETTIETLLADPAAKAVVDKHIPGFSLQPQIGMASAMTLGQINQMAPAQITKEMLAAIDADLAKLPGT
jgi:hypothetical protein